uniref:transcription factor Jun-like n=1 Tax=Myxine glutinosa TaxID=7769 RepID=UPI00358E3358
MNPRMEAPFYHDDALNVAFGAAESAMPLVLSAASSVSSAASSSTSSSVSSHAAAAAAKKKKLTLNLHDPSGNLKPHLRAAEQQQGGLLKLASPELEHLIIQSGNGLVTTTPTPTQFLCPRNVTDEQEGFADGFVKALEELHKQNQLSGAASPAAVAAAVAAAAAVCAPGQQQQQQQQAQPVGPGASEAPVYATLNSYGHQQQPPQSQQSFGFGAFPLTHPRLSALKEEPQTVPELGSSPPPLSPIDMETQERIKAERKRLRNRIAASKCRKRKLERIARLEDRVKALKAQNSDLATTAGALREQVASLKQKVMKHVTSGCRLMVNQQMQGF